MARRCCRPRLILFAMLGGVALYGWYGTLVLLLDSNAMDSTPQQQPGSGAAILETKYMYGISAISSMETHRLSDAEALVVGTPEVCLFVCTAQ